MKLTNQQLLHTITQNLDFMTRCALASVETDRQLKHKLLPSIKGIWNRAICTAPRIRVIDSVSGDVAKMAAISIKARLHLNVYKGTKSVYLY
jgi:hypothetical protein